MRLYRRKQYLIGYNARYNIITSKRTFDTIFDNYTDSGYTTSNFIRNDKFIIYDGEQFKFVGYAENIADLKDLFPEEFI